MKKILRLNFSPRGYESESYRLSQGIIERLKTKEPKAELIDCFLGDGGIKHVDTGYAVSQGGPADISQEGTIIHSEKFIMDLESADYVVISTPMHNLTVPSTLKAWIDHIVRVRRTFNITHEGKVGTLSGRPTFIAIASGGRYSGDRANQPDFLTPYLKYILTMIGLKDLHIFSIQGTGGASSHTLGEIRKQADEDIRAYFSAFPE